MANQTRLFELAISGMKPERCFTLEPLLNVGFSVVPLNILHGQTCSQYIDLNNTPGSINLSNIFCAEPHGIKASIHIKRVRSEFN